MNPKLEGSFKHPMYLEIFEKGMRAKPTGKILSRLGNTPIALGMRVKDNIMIGTYIEDIVFTIDPRLVVLLMKTQLQDIKDPGVMLVQPAPTHLWVPEGFRK